MDALPVALLAGVLAAGVVGALFMAFTPSPPKLDTPSLGTASDRRLALAGLVAGFCVLAATRWPVAAVAAGVFVASWRWLFTSTENADDRATIEAVAQWLEDLRDVVRRSSVAIENAVELVAEDATGVLAEPMYRFLLHRRQGRSLPDSLAVLADDIAHPTADAGVAAIILVVGGGAGGGRIYDTLDELSMAARDEMRARDEIDRTRRVFQRAMRRLVVMTVVFVAGLAVFASDLLSPYRTFEGQVWLLVPCGLWATCLVMLRRLTRYDLGTRYRLRLPSEVG